MEKAWGPSARSSSTPVTSTRCGAFQFSGVKVSRAGAAWPSPGASDAKATETAARGGSLRATVKLAWAPASEGVPWTAPTGNPGGGGWGAGGRRAGAPASEGVPWTAPTVNPGGGPEGGSTSVPHEHAENRQAARAPTPRRKRADTRRMAIMTVFESRGLLQPEDQIIVVDRIAAVAGGHRTGHGPGDHAEGHVCVIGQGEIMDGRRVARLEGRPGQDPRPVGTPAHGGRGIDIHDVGGVGVVRHVVRHLQLRWLATPQRTPLLLH